MPCRVFFIGYKWRIKVRYLLLVVRIGPVPAGTCVVRHVFVLVFFVDIVALLFAVDHQLIVTQRKGHIFRIGDQTIMYQVGNKFLISFIVQPLPLFGTSPAICIPILRPP